MGGFTERGGWWVAGQFVLLGLLLALWTSWSGDWGSVAAGAGILLGGWGLLALGGNLTPYPSPKEDATLVERGPYRLVRHPIYGGVVLSAAGLSLADGNAGGLTVTLGLFLLFLGKSEFEEERLLARFPSYDEYRRRVPKRLIPWVV